MGDGRKRILAMAASIPVLEMIGLFTASTSFTRDIAGLAQAVKIAQ